ncbi:LysE/ArgO family amino acid transporter [Candidatus Portiera aleyrodidarum]|uniref:Lysine transporter LysE n=1 Tax=Candidatus Portiera aleyrodidarum MED (Bemisia tabaci) TaxID=1163752 RepID=A0AAU8RSD9_9GAMM|nr:LysE family transporter [Candidatus Portiera aleyrodidarum]AFQ24014.1 lysine efflux permease [Candidatus Portiera aleyrodidarum BT-B-HRs]AFS18780.1 Arginine exporter protein ArgO [Candidatus Portiera aleyrodidarum BT-QVLC]AFT80403.1 Lysine efflux permease [Candidatus Portiera aleyrodidarum BT-QVLC]AFT80684.1 Lysine efflux permease [Candidatus Portiera aleyrodidarum BT-B-HRs]AJF23993.1 lysine transporter LysE [Candidatus Portiera aleyrodidarum MED (Bemisia tabaci)]
MGLLSGCNGLILGGALIIVIGAQNAFVLNQGLRGNYPWMVAFICALCDVILTATGVAGLSVFIQNHKDFIIIARWIGIFFLILQSIKAFVRMRESEQLQLLKNCYKGRLSIFFYTLAITLLNPHVYFDTLLMLGTIGASQACPFMFVLGAGLASFLWFFSLIFIARTFKLLLASSKVWRLLDLITGIILLFVAWQLLLPF